MNKEIKILSNQELESKYCTAIEADCDGEYSYPMDNKQIKECYLDYSEHRDLFIQVLEYKINKIKKQLDVKISSDERHIKCGLLIGLEIALNTYYNVHNQADKINNDQEKGVAK